MSQLVRTACQGESCNIVLRRFLRQKGKMVKKKTLIYSNIYGSSHIHIATYIILLCS